MAYLSETQKNRARNLESIEQDLERYKYKSKASSIEREQLLKAHKLRTQGKNVATVEIF